MAITSAQQNAFGINSVTITNKTKGICTTVQQSTLQSSDQRLSDNYLWSLTSSCHPPFWVPPSLALPLLPSWPLVSASVSLPLTGPFSHRRPQPHPRPPA